MKLSLLVTVLLLCGVALSAPNYEFGSYHKLFSAQSLWNSRPINPVFSSNPNATIQASVNAWYPTIDTGDYSSGIYRAVASDSPVTLYGRAGSKGVVNVDEIVDNMPNITIPRWPAAAVPAVGDDGHLDIVDEVTGILHSLWRAKWNTNLSRWECSQYAWTRVDGLGFGDASHYYIGARAAGVPTSAGIIRQHEIDDGEAYYKHALTMSLAHNSLGFKPAYIYPATHADEGAEYSNYGYIPEGGLLMLPSTYNTSRHNAYPRLKKVAETLKMYGAYVTDRNTATPYAIYVENHANSTWGLGGIGPFDGNLASQLQAIRTELRLVVDAEKYVDGNGDTLLPRTKINMFSMRATHTWARQYGDAKARFDSWSQSLVFEGNNTASTRYTQTNGDGYNKVSWATFRANRTYVFSVEGTVGVSLFLQIWAGSAKVNETRSLRNGQNTTFDFPARGGYLYFFCTKDVGGPGSIRAIIYEKETATVAPTASPTADPTDSATGSTSGSTSGPTSVTTTEPGVPVDDNSSSVVQLGLCTLLVMFAVLLL